MSNSNVRGPTSALTEFLRSKNISVPNANRFRRANSGRIDLSAEAVDQALNELADVGTSSSSALLPGLSDSPPPPKAARPVNRRPAKSASMRFDEDSDTESEAEEDGDELVDGSPGPSKRKAAPGQQSNNKKAKTGTDAASSKSSSVIPDRPPGSLNWCAQCKTKFSVTRYTKKSAKGQLCHKCGANAVNHEEEMAAPKAAPKKRAQRRKPINEDVELELPKLQTLCINVIAKNIDDVEALGGVGVKNRNAISKSISKNRSLTSKTVQLFLDKEVTQLSLYDCSKLDSAALSTFPTFAPEVETLNLQLCGQLDDDALNVWSEKMLHLRRLELYGPYLVRIAAWHKFFESIGERLESFKIRESPRFDLGCAEKLVENCPNLRELGLAQIGKLDASVLKPLEVYTQLTWLDVSDPGVSAPGVPPKSLGDEEMISMLKAVGKNLRYLNFSGNADLTSRLLTEGVKTNCLQLEELHMSSCSGIDGDGVKELFHDWETLNGGDKPLGLQRLSLNRILSLDDDAMSNVLAHSGGFLTYLNVNSCDKLTKDILLRISRECTQLVEVDLGFVRALDDVTVMDLCTNLPSLRKLWLFGCNRVSNIISSNRRVRIIGQQNAAIV